MAAEGEATTAGLNSIHECIGAVDPVVGYGTDEQKASASCRSWLPVSVSPRLL